MADGDEQPLRASGVLRAANSALQAANSILARVSGAPQVFEARHGQTNQVRLLMLLVIWCTPPELRCVRRPFVKVSSTLK